GSDAGELSVELPARRERVGGAEARLLGARDVVDRGRVEPAAGDLALERTAGFLEPAAERARHAAAVEGEPELRRVERQRGVGVGRARRPAGAADEARVAAARRIEREVAELAARQLPLGRVARPRVAALEVVHRDEALDLAEERRAAEEERPGREAGPAD